MALKNNKKLFISQSNITIKTAMQKIAKNGARCLVIVDTKKRLLGTLNDGDIRRALLQKASLDSSIKSYICSKPFSFRDHEFTMNFAKTEFQKNNFDLIPILNADNCVIDIITQEHAFIEKNLNYKKKISNTSAVIMAGGFGTRMQPFTSILPKPLIPINSKSVIEHIIGRFSDHGIQNFFLTLNYKAELIKAYFKDLKPDYKTNFVIEDKPLGTAGSLAMTQIKSNNFFLINCDTIIDCDLHELHQFHIKSKNMLTIVASPYEHTLPFGACNVDEKGQLVNIEEKPSRHFLVNTGLYLVNKNVLKIIPKNLRMDMPDLINSLMSKGKKVGVFPLNLDEWIDVGQWEEFRAAVEKMS